MYELNICHLYPDILNLYGDGGNITAMQKRMEWRGFSAKITEVFVGEKFNPNDFDIFFMGGGQDFEQSVLLEDLKGGKSKDIISAVEDEKVFLTICGGYQLLGQYRKDLKGEQTDFLGALDIYTIDQKKRFVGDFKFKLTDSDGGNEIIGFENHSGLTYLGDKVKPLGNIIKGFGNNGKDGTEGARYKNVFASYSHGPLLPKNPQLCDLILKTALLRKYPNVSLDALDDNFELNAYRFMQDRLK